MSRPGRGLKFCPETNDLLFPRENKVGVHAHACMHAWAGAGVPARMHAYMHAHKCMHARARLHACMYCTHARAHCMHTCTPARAHTLARMHARMHACTHTRTCARMHTHQRENVLPLRPAGARTPGVLL